MKNKKMFPVVMSGKKGRALLLLASLVFMLPANALAAAKMYFTEAGPTLYNLQRANTDGTSLEVIVPDDGVNNLHEEMFVDPSTNTLYFVDDRADLNPGIYKVDLTGTFPATPTLVIGHDGIKSIAFDSTNSHIYYSTANSTPIDYALYRCNLDGTNKTSMIPDDGVWSPSDIWLDEAGATLYIADGPGNRIAKISTTSLPATTATLSNVITAAGPVNSIFGYAGKIYYSDTTSYNLSRVNFDGTGNEILIPDDAAWGPTALYVDDTSAMLYLADNASTNSIRRIAVASLPTATTGASALTQVIAKKAAGILVYSDNAAPAISIANTTLAYTENDVVTQIDSAATLSDPNGDADWNAGTLAVQITTNNEAADEISIPDNVVGTINTSGLNLLNGATTIGTLSASEGTVTNGTKLTITFNANATNTLVQQVLRAIHYRNTSNYPGVSNRTVTFTATDKNSGSGSDTRTISVAAVNDAPSFSAGASLSAVNEDTAAPAGATVTSLLGGNYTDPDSGDSLAGIAVSADASVAGVEGEWQYTTDGSTWYGIGSVSTASSLLLDVNAKLRFVPFTNYNGTPGSLTVYAVDSSSATTFTSGAIRQSFDTTADNSTSKVSAAGVSVGTSITAVNDAPVITGQTTLSMLSDTSITITLGDLTVTDPDNSYPTGFTLTLYSGANYSLSGNIVIPAPAYVGDLTVPVTVNDGALDSVVFNLLVTVNLGNTAPTISGTPATIVSGHNAYSFVPTANDVDGDPLTFLITNKPTWASFNTATGELSGTPTNSDVGTTTGIVIKVNDGTVIVSLAPFDLTVSENLDIDGDGMPNDWEIANGFDPLNPSDAALDIDGDGLSNLEEYLASKDPRKDDNPPVVTPPADVTVDATGLFTGIDIGTATALDAYDGSVSTSSDAPSHFSPGTHTVTWSATDAAGNTGTATQTVNVNPQVSFDKDQTTAEGGTVTFRVILNGPAVSYPVTIPYTVGGTASTDGSDHNLTNGNILINSGTAASVSVITVDDGPGEGTESVVITMGIPTNAVTGAHAVDTIEIVEGNVSPEVTLSAVQGAGQTQTIVTGNGLVTVSSMVIDSNIADTLSYDWAGTENALIDTDVAIETFTFDPSALTPGFYVLRLSVSDGMAAGNAELTLNVLAVAPTLSSTNDSDGDGITDAVEGYGDTDGDGIADYLEAIDSSNVLQEIRGQENSLLIETEPGLQLNLGNVAFRSGQSQAMVSMSDIATYGGIVADSYQYAGGLFDFTVDEIPLSGQSVKVVLPQQAAVPANAVYRKALNGLWQNFVEDANNNVASAAGAQGYCPPPGDSAYTPGLAEGHWCVQLTIEDGGPNDADGLPNNSVADPGGVTSIQSSETLRVDSGGGSVSPWLLILLGVLLWQTKRSAGGRVMKRFAIAGMCSCLLLSSSAFAGEWSVGARMGWATGDTGTSDLNKELAAQGLNVTASSSDDTRGAWQLFVGYDYSPNWGVEAAYVDLGEVTTSLTGNAADIDAVLAAPGDIYPNTAQGWQLSGAYHRVFEAYPELQANARLGAFVWKSEYNLHGATSSRQVDKSGTDISMGLGLEMELDRYVKKGFSASINWDRYSIDSEPIDLFTVGLSYRFE